MVARQREVEIIYGQKSAEEPTVKGLTVKASALHWTLLMST
jgi:hypothetical protein